MTQCGTLACQNEAEPGSKYCKECRPKYEKKNVSGSAIDAARCRVAKAEDDVAKILQELQAGKYATLTGLDYACKEEPDHATGPAHVLRRRYNNAVRERRQARSDLDRLRNELQQRERAARARLEEVNAKIRRGYIDMDQLNRAVANGVDSATKLRDEHETAIKELAACEWRTEEERRRPGETAQKAAEVKRCNHCGKDLGAYAVSSWDPSSDKLYCSMKCKDEHKALKAKEPAIRSGPAFVGDPSQLREAILGKNAVTVDPYRDAMQALGIAHNDLHLLQADPLIRFGALEDLPRKAESDPKARELLVKYRKAMELRKELRKAAAAQAPRNSCWNCIGFSRDNYAKPCRDGHLKEGDLPIVNCPHFDETYDSKKRYGAVPKPDAPAAPKQQAAAPEAPAPWWEGGPIDTIRQLPWHDAVQQCPPGRSVILLAGRYEWQGTKGELRRSERFDVEEGLQWTPELVMEYIATGQEDAEVGKPAKRPKKAVAQVMDENARKAEAEREMKTKPKQVDLEGKPAAEPRRSVQVDLNGDKLRLPDGVTEESVVSRKRKFEDGIYTLSISEKDLLEFNGMWIDRKQKLVAAKLRPNPMEDDEFDPDDLPEEIEKMVRVLNIASLNLQTERLKQGLAGVA